MPNQLTLIETGIDWRISDDVRETGRRGVALARAALAASHEPHGDPPHNDAGQHQTAA